jgi:hypothetical protein
MIRQRVNAGLKRALEAGKTLGRPRLSAAINQRTLDEGKPDLIVAFPGGGGTKGFNRSSSQFRFCYA